MEDGNSYSNRSRGVLWRSLRDGDFEEEDVWAVPKESKDSTFKSDQSIESSDIVVTRHLPSAARMIPSLSEMSDVGTCCSTSTAPDDGANGGVTQQQSDPVNIPQWSNVSTKMRNGSCHHDEDDDDDGDGSETDDDEYNAKFAPHEIIARRLARNQISSFSVFEGVGRKLKGRDLTFEESEKCCPNKNRFHRIIFIDQMNIIRTVVFLLGLD